MADLPILFLHIGWAREYLGQSDDLPQGKFGYIKENGGGDVGENLNFLPFKGRCYGYAPAQSINMKRLGGNADDEYIDGVLVIWTATAPDMKGGRYIVGWYKNARVYATMLEKRPVDKRQKTLTWIVCEAAETDCQRVLVDERTFYIPSMKTGWPGVSSSFFASETLSGADIDKIVEYVNGTPSSGFAETDNLASKKTGKLGRSVDPVMRAKVEVAAVEAVIAHYEERKWSCENVEKDNCGWDLTFTFGERELYVEVKGRAAEGSVELTPNEYKEMCSDKRRMNYRLAIVFNALSPVSRQIAIFEYAPGKECWVSESGQVLQLKEKTGAIAEILLK